MDEVLPIHLGFILDGNRRWAKERGLKAFDGHKAGVDVVEGVAEEALARGVKFLSLFIFSTENWSRSKKEVNYLMDLILITLKSTANKFKEKNIKINILGSKDKVRADILKTIDEVEAKTANCTGGVLSFCFNYGGQLEIADAVKSIISKGVKPSEVTPDLIAKYLYHPEIPPVDMIVRTSGERRISNFMLWRSAYSELMFIDKHWPDMTKDDVAIIIEEYAKRNRRYGG